MKKLLLFLALATAWPAFGQAPVVNVRADTNGVLKAPLSFFSANASLIDDNFVTLDSAQTITGPKTFTLPVTNKSGFYVTGGPTNVATIIGLLATNADFGLYFHGPLALTNNFWLIYPTNAPPAGKRMLTVRETTFGATGVTNFLDWDSVLDSDIPAGITRDTEWDTAAEINAATTDDDFVTLAGAQTVSGNKTFSGVVTLPSGAAPVTDATGEFALDTTITDHKPLWQYYSGADEMLLLAVRRADLSTVDGQVLMYDAANDKLTFGAGGGGGSGVPQIVTNSYVSGTTNFSIDATALTNDAIVRITLTQASGLLATNAYDGKRFRLEVTEDNTGTWKLVLNTNILNNWRLSQEITGPNIFTNANYISALGIVVRGTNFWLTANLTGFAP